ncbi:hypothetical protein HDE_13168 [Halotydeus destructor]|nr:hypothetical protein HDE_13168 [Halotydeus destructor]
MQKSAYRCDKGADFVRRDVTDRILGIRTMQQFVDYKSQFLHKPKPITTTPSTTTPSATKPTPGLTTGSATPVPIPTPTKASTQTPTKSPGSGTTQVHEATHTTNKAPDRPTGGAASTTGSESSGSLFGFIAGVMAGLVLLLLLAALYFLALKKRPKSRGSEPSKRRFPTMIVTEPETENDEDNTKKWPKSAKFETQADFSEHPSIQYPTTPKKMGAIAIATDEDAASTITYGVPTPKSKGVLEIAPENDE